MSRRLLQESQARVGDKMGPWKLERLLGFGSAAAVYAVTDGARVAALKTLHKNNQLSEQVCARFRREAEVTMSIDHENVVKVYDVGTSQDGELYMAMEMLDGLALDEFLSRKGGKLSARSSLRIAQQLIAGLAASHAEEIIHRDLKPSNVYITRQRVIKLLDFGVAHVEQTDQRLTMDGTVLGTPAFMPPEQARGRLDMLDERSDTFAAGALLFHMLTGRYVHEGANIDEALILAATRPAESVASFEPNLPDRVIALVDRALAWNPARRFQDAGEMLEEVEACLDVKAALNERSKGIKEAATAALMASVQSEEHESSEASSEERAEAQEQDEDLKEMLAAAGTAFGQIERSLDMGRKYSWSHAETKAQIGRAYDALLACIAAYPEEAIFMLRPYSFNLNGHDVWEPREPFDEITYNMFSCGIRSMHFKPTLSQQEFEALLRIMTMDPRKDLPPEDDLATALWEANLDNVQVQMVSTFRLDDAAEQTLFIEECEEEQKRVQQFMGEARKLQVERAQILLSMGEDALAEAQGAMINHAASPGSAQGPAIEGAISREEVSRLASVLASSPPLAQQLPFVLADSYREAIRGGEREKMDDALRDYFARFVRRQKFVGLLRTHARLCLTLRDPELTSTLTAELFTDEIFETVLDNLTLGLTEQASEQQRAILQDESILTHLKELLVNLGPQHAGAVSKFYPRVENFKPLVRLFYGYLRKHLAGNEERVGEIIPRVGLQHARAFIELLKASNTPDAQRALRHANYHPDAALKLEMLEWRAERTPDDVAFEVMDLAQSDSPDLRVRAFQIAKRHNVPGLAAWITERARMDEFYELPYSERRLMLALLTEQDQRAALTLAIEILTTHGLTVNPTRVTTRLLAVEILSQMPTTAPVLEALDMASKRRPWNSKELQEASAAAIKRHRGGR